MDAVYIGIDVSKKALDLADTQRDRGRIDNTPAEHVRLAKRLKKQTPTLVALEATGGYERPVVEALMRAGCPSPSSSPPASGTWPRA